MAMGVRTKATRYKIGKDADDSGGFNLSTQPCCVIVLKREKEEEGERDEDKFEGQKAQKEKLTGKLRAVGLQVSESVAREGDYWFLKISASDPVLKYEAEQMQLKLKAKRSYGGAMYRFERRIVDLYEKSLEGDLFSSLQQLQIIEKIVKGKLEDGGADYDPEDMAEWLPDDEDVPGGAFFYLHHDATRQTLQNTWAKSWTKAQPMDQIREYFGEKVALYFTWLGFYTTMLWLPALVGIMLTASQIYTSYYTGSLDNPWVPLYCAFTALWASAYLCGWRRLENKLKLEWATSEFEEMEEEREGYIKDVRTMNPITSEEEWTSSSRERYVKIALSSIVVLFFIIAVITVVSGIMAFKSELGKTFAFLGPMLGGVLNAISIIIFNEIWGHFSEELTERENWRTETQHEDALIAKDFCFKFVNAYFSLFFVAFVQNYMKVFGKDLHCPHWHCMPVLTMTLATVFATQLFVGQFTEIGWPIMAEWWRKRSEEQKIREQGKAPAPLKPEEEQAKMEDYEGVFDDYNEMVVQFGYVTLFAAAFPLTATLALANNLIEIRSDASKMVMATKRPHYSCAADIGTWMTILDIIVTVAIMTNCCLVGFTSHGMFFYFDEMDSMDRIWVTVISEHVLMFLKALLQSLVPDVSDEALEEEEFRQSKLKESIEKLKQQRKEAQEALATTDDEGM
mmetsp:Transcript_17284/g.40673  ORF Transcript_17284/g.40673 Transcript_17284/m.40673 type:complete len:681 (-) Transcript_17284:525-2567(-)|eukprot:CAMPEP_0114555886 /NCGR_PEP_ID=MMETSP0114-20121206/8988_1 /TAXON_ID=31324 /ORGANISM="Goniomonas sp, Strain m" /LENGTH=680 /DNA_ID=CAMNT_0001741041 /DNA_START=35 /DNA_END=2077 /DNA_ORIENTATION=+